MIQTGNKIFITRIFRLAGYIFKLRTDARAGLISVENATDKNWRH